MARGRVHRGGAGVVVVAAPVGPAPPSVTTTDVVVALERMILERGSRGRTEARHGQARLLRHRGGACDVHRHCEVPAAALTDADWGEASRDLGAGRRD